MYLYINEKRHKILLTPYGKKKKNERTIYWKPVSWGSGPLCPLLPIYRQSKKPLQLAAIVYILIKCFWNNLQQGKHHQPFRTTRSGQSSGNDMLYHKVIAVRDGTSKMITGRNILHNLCIAYLHTHTHTFFCPPGNPVIPVEGCRQADWRRGSRHWPRNFKGFFSAFFPG